jgi:transcriptional regulator with PAS, ATPase and Fis domain
MKEAELHAASDVPVLITGESGTGKELMARAMHVASPRSQHPFTPINMASVSASLFEAEFFGHTRGAFTGAERQRSGYVESGDRGTLFLDEIGNLEAGLQGKLLRVLQDGEYRQLGASRHRRADVRFIAATNENLVQLIEQGRFRPDLYYRIRGGWLQLPPLRARKEDIPLLVEAFLKRFQPPNSETRVDSEAMCLLMAHDYPGNVRELMTVIQTAVNLAQGGPITTACLPKEMRRGSALSACRANFEGNTTLPLAEVEKRHILNVYQQTGSNKSQTARVLGIGLNTLRRRLKQYGTL